MPSVRLGDVRVLFGDGLSYRRSYTETGQDMEDLASGLDGFRGDPDHWIV